MIVSTDQYMGHLLALKTIDGGLFQVNILDLNSKRFIAATEIYVDAETALGEARRQVDALSSA